VRRRDQLGGIFLTYNREAAYAEAPTVEAYSERHKPATSSGLCGVVIARRTQ
jgi:hypothetical protein